MGLFQPADQISIFVIAAFVVGMRPPGTADQIAVFIVAFQTVYMDGGDFAD